MVENPDVVKATPLPDLFRNDFWGTPLASPASHQSYRPLAVLAFRAVFRLGGLRPEPFHAAVWAAYAVSCALFVRVCRRVVFADPAPGRLLLCGLLALHFELGLPEAREVQRESVARARCPLCEASWALLARILPEQLP